MSVRDAMWIIGIFIALGATWGMTSQRINAMERDIDRTAEAWFVYKNGSYQKFLRAAGEAMEQHYKSFR